MTPGEEAVARARAEWKKSIFDPQIKDNSPAALTSKQAITTYIRDGLGWHSWKDESPNGAQVSAYGGDGTFQWCGAFAAYAWASVDPAVRVTSFASTYRLWDLGQRVPAWRVALTDIEPGDILVVGPDGKQWGTHITLATDTPTNGCVPTIEGNANGLLYGGGWGQGVVCNVRALAGSYRIRFAYRPPAAPTIH